MAETGTQEAVDLSICVDCLFYLANGEVTDENGKDITAEHGEKIAKMWAGSDLTLGTLTCECRNTEGETHTWFSWSDCDGCGSILGGDREHATAWYTPAA